MNANAPASDVRGAAANAPGGTLLPAIGERFAGYRLHKLLGRGAIGTVHLASTPKRRLVALKTLALPAASDREERALVEQRFTAETQAAMRLRHPNVVRVYACGVERGLGFVAMEPVPGCTLERYAEPARLLPEPLVIHVGAAIADALAHAHAQGVLHRDVKPANVMVDIASRRVKVCDFGLARLADQARTRTGLVMGTPAFMAPELLAGAAAHAGSDLYALGVLLYQLVSGRLPHEGHSMGDLLRSVAAGEVRPLAGLRRDAMPALVALVHRLLDGPPSGRPSDALDVAQQLRALAAPSRSGATGKRAPATDPATA